MKFFYYLLVVATIILAWSCEEENDYTSVKEQLKADSLRADSIKKQNEIKLLGTWHIISYAGTKLDTGVMKMQFSSEENIQIITPNDTHEGTYELKEEQKIISVIADKKPEEWLVKSYTPKQMILEAEDKEERIDVILKRFD